jgi:hypothetical protein
LVINKVEIDKRATKTEKKGKEGFGNKSESGTTTRIVNNSNLFILLS